MRIKTVKMTGGKIHIAAEVGNSEDGPNLVDIKFWDEARPEFYRALSSLKKYLMELCELENLPPKSIKITGVKFTYAGAEGLMGAKILATRQLSTDGDILHLVTPHRLSEQLKGDKADDSGVFAEKCVVALKSVISESEEYFKGARHQTDLFVK